MKPILWYPAKPFYVTQAWGIDNPSYKQFGFSKHNGVDFLIGKDGMLYAPIRMELIEKDYYPTGAGNFGKYRTMEKYDVDGVNAKFCLMFMHMKAQPSHPLGTVLEIGDLIGPANNTGFSTGPHTHMANFVVDDLGNKIGKNMEANQTFDPRPYFNGRYAVDALNMVQQLKDLIAKLTELIKLKK